MNLIINIAIEFLWFGGWDMELCLYSDLRHWTWFKRCKDCGDLADTIFGEKLGCTGRYLYYGIRILCFSFSLEGSK